MFNWFIKLWRRLFPLKKTTRIDLFEDDPRFSIEEGDGRKWRTFHRVLCPRCGTQAQILGIGKINDKVRCAKQCGMRGYFDGIYIVWNNTFKHRG